MTDTTVRASSGNNGSSTSLSVAAPSGTAVGDLVLCWCHVNGANTLTDNNGSTPFTKDATIGEWNYTAGTNATLSFFWRRFQSGDPTTFNFTAGTTGAWSVIAVALQNPDASVEFDVAPTRGNTASGLSVTSIDITTLNDKAIHFAWAAYDNTGAPGWTGFPATGYTGDQSLNVDHGTAVQHKVITPAGATGAQTFTTGTADTKGAMSLAVRNNNPVVTIPNKILSILQAINRAASF